MANKSSSIKDVAKLAGVSVATVSYVLNQTKSVSAETRERVMKAIHELHYLPNQTARDLKTQRSDLVGVIVPDLNNWYFSQLVAAAEAALGAQGFQMIVCNSNGSTVREEQFLYAVHARLKGLLIVPAGSETSRLFREWDQDGCPVVFMEHRPIPSDLAPYVVSNNEQAGRDAFHHLSERYSSLALIAPQPATDTERDRIAGFMASAIAKERPVLTAWRDREGGRLAGQRQMEKILEQHLGHPIVDSVDSYTSNNGILGVYCTTNSMAIGCVLTLRAHGIAIGDKVGVLVQDDADWLLLSQPTISTVYCDPALLGNRAVQLLTHRIENRLGMGEIILPPQVIIRMSTVGSVDTVY